MNPMCPNVNPPFKIHAACRPTAAHSLMSSIMRYTGRQHCRVMSALRCAYVSSSARCVWIACVGAHTSWQWRTSHRVGQWGDILRRVRYMHCQGDGLFSGWWHRQALVCSKNDPDVLVQRHTHCGHNQTTVQHPETTLISHKRHNLQSHVPHSYVVVSPESDGDGHADMWSAEASLNCEHVNAPANEDGGMEDGDEDQGESVYKCNHQTPRIMILLGIRTR